MGRRSTVLKVLLRVGAFAACAQLAVAYPFVAAAQHQRVPSSLPERRRSSRPPATPGAPAAQAPGAAWPAAGRFTCPGPNASLHRDERGHTLRAVRVIEGEEGPEGADDRDAARSRRDAYDDDAAQRDRSRGSRRLHPAGTDGATTRVAGSARRRPRDAAALRRQTQHPTPHHRTRSPTRHLERRSAERRRTQSGAAEPGPRHHRDDVAGARVERTPTIRRTCAS